MKTFIKNMANSTKTWVKDHPRTCGALAGNVIGTAICWMIIPKITATVVIIDAVITVATTGLAYAQDDALLVVQAAVLRSM